MTNAVEICRLLSTNVVAKNAVEKDRRNLSTAVANCRTPSKNIVEICRLLSTNVECCRNLLAKFVEKCCRKMMSKNVVKKNRTLSKFVECRRLVAKNVVEFCRKKMSKNVVEKCCRKKLSKKKFCRKKKNFVVEEKILCRIMSTSSSFLQTFDIYRQLSNLHSTILDIFRQFSSAKNAVEFCCRILLSNFVVEFCCMLLRGVEICRPLHRSYCRLVSNVECCRILLCRIMGLRVAEWGLSNCVECRMLSDVVVFRYRFIVFRYIFVELRGLLSRDVERGNSYTTLQNSTQFIHNFSTFSTPCQILSNAVYS